MAHPRARLTVFGRQLLDRSGGGRLAGRPRRRAARDQPGDRVQVGPASSSRGRGRPRRPLVTTAALTAPPEPDRRGRDPRRPGELAVRTRPARSAARTTALDRPPGPRPARPQPAARRRPGDGGTDPLCRLPPGRARPPGPQEARADPRRRRLAGARPGRTDASRPQRTPATSTSRSSIDDASRYAVVVPVPDETAASAAARPGDRGAPSSPGSGSGSSAS